jgi:hypothetical protein
MPCLLRTCANAIGHPPGQGRAPSVIATQQPRQQLTAYLAIVYPGDVQSQLLNASREPIGLSELVERLGAGCRPSPKAGDSAYAFWQVPHIGQPISVRKCTAGHVTRGRFSHVRILMLTQMIRSFPGTDRKYPERLITGPSERGRISRGRMHPARAGSGPSGSAGPITQTRQNAFPECLIRLAHELLRQPTAGRSYSEKDAAKMSVAFSPHTC